MMMTSRGAEETNCPILILADRNNIGDTGCLGVGCMMWRWSEPPPLPEFIPCRDVELTVDPGDRPEGAENWIWIPGWDKQDAGWAEPGPAADARRLGYCGLAGEPRGGE